jgi:hypothetical protein
LARTLIKIKINLLSPQDRNYVLFRLDTLANEMSAVGVLERQGDQIWRLLVELFCIFGQFSKSYSHSPKLGVFISLSI